MMSHMVPNILKYKQNFFIKFNSILFGQGAVFLYRSNVKRKNRLDKKLKKIYHVRVLKKYRKKVRG